MTIEELEAENKALKEENQKLKAWVDYHEGRKIRDMWREAAEDAPRRNREIQENCLRSQLPKL